MNGNLQLDMVSHMNIAQIINDFLLMNILYYHEYTYLMVLTVYFDLQPGVILESRSKVVDLQPGVILESTSKVGDLQPGVILESRSKVVDLQPGVILESTSTG